MSENKLDEVWNPFGVELHTMSLTERQDMERARAWAYYLNGGGGDPSYFDGYTHMKNAERER